MKFDILSLRKEQRSYNWTDFHEIWYLVSPKGTAQLQLDGFSWNLISCLSKRNSAATTGRIFVKFDILSVCKEQLCYNWTDFYEIWYLVCLHGTAQLQLVGFSWNLISCLSARNSSATTGRIFMKFDILSVCKEQLGYNWTDFHEIWYLSIFRKSIENIQVSLTLWSLTTLIVVVPHR